MEVPLSTVIGSFTAWTGSGFRERICLNIEFFLSFGLDEVQLSPRISIVRLVRLTIVPDHHDIQPVRHLLAARKADRKSRQCLFSSTAPVANFLSAILVADARRSAIVLTIAPLVRAWGKSFVVSVPYGPNSPCRVNSDWPARREFQSGKPVAQNTSPTWSSRSKSSGNQAPDPLSNPYLQILSHHRRKLRMVLEA